MNNLNVTLARDESLARIFRIGNENPDSLTEDEWARYGFIRLSGLRTFESMYFHSLQGTATELWNSHKEHITVLMKNPSVHQMQQI